MQRRSEVSKKLARLWIAAAQILLLPLARLFQRAFGDRANQQFKQFCVHGPMIALPALGRPTRRRPGPGPQWAV